MIPLVISERVREKLTSKHQVQEQEVRECFYNHDGKYLVDEREDHRTDPATLWFIGETYRGRKLKVIFVPRDGELHLKSAYEPKDRSEDIYTALTRNTEST